MIFIAFFEEKRSVELENCPGSIPPDTKDPQLLELTQDWSRFWRGWVGSELPAWTWGA